MKKKQKKLSPQFQRIPRFLIQINKIKFEKSAVMHRLVLCKETTTTKQNLIYSDKLADKKLNYCFIILQTISYAVRYERTMKLHKFNF